MVEFTMSYKCERCGEEWEMTWDCACDDRCPSCDLAHEPVSVKETPDE